MRRQTQAVRLKSRQNGFSSMKLTINGSPHEVPSGLTIASLLVHLGLVEGPVAVEVNRQIVPRAEHAAHRLDEDDILEIVHLVGGG